MTGLEALENIKHYDSRVGLHEDDYETIKKEPCRKGQGDICKKDFTRMSDI